MAPVALTGCIKSIKAVGQCLAELHGHRGDYPPIDKKRYTRSSCWEVNTYQILTAVEGDTLGYPLTEHLISQGISRN